MGVKGGCMAHDGLETCILYLCPVCARDTLVTPLPFEVKCISIGTALSRSRETVAGRLTVSSVGCGNRARPAPYCAEVLLAKTGEK